MDHWKKATTNCATLMEALTAITHATDLPAEAVSLVFDQAERQTIDTWMAEHYRRGVRAAVFTNPKTGAQALEVRERFAENPAWFVCKALDGVRLMEGETYSIEKLAPSVEEVLRNIVEVLDERDDGVSADAAERWTGEVHLAD
jgi:hypothetical protein